MDGSGEWLGFLIQRGLCLMRRMHWEVWLLDLPSLQCPQSVRKALRPDRVSTAIPLPDQAREEGIKPKKYLIWPLGAQIKPYMDYSP